MLLPTLRSLNAAVIEELFFAGLIGNVQIDSIIPYILRMDSSDFSAGSCAPAASPLSPAVDQNHEIPHPFSSPSVSAIIHSDYASNGLLNLTGDAKKYCSSSQSHDAMLTAAVPSSSVGS